MLRHNIIYREAFFELGRNLVGQFGCRSHTKSCGIVRDDARVRLFIERTKVPCIVGVLRLRREFRIGKVSVTTDQSQGGLMEDDDDLCPVECVREFKTDEEFSRILEKAKEDDSLVVVDFYRTSCGSCKYIEQGFRKLCKVSGNKDAPVIFLKHNVIDEYDEQSEVAERLRIKVVPLFHFYKNGVLLEAFPTRDKEKIVGAILKYSSLSPEDI